MRRTWLALALMISMTLIAHGETPKPPVIPLWSLAPLAKVSVPTVADASNPIDSFVRDRLKRDGLTPNPAADRPTLIRRVTHDLHGLPPTPAEVTAFVNDTRPDAYERVIDRLLASPRYGERMARHWLDIVRFTESDGFERDRPRYDAWPYRDYVIAAMNADTPYPRFIQEQIAGDVLPDATANTIAATGLLVTGAYDEVAANVGNLGVRNLARQDELEEMLATVGQTVLGLTVNCARCHDHKFDPIPTRDYYRMQSVFAGTYRGSRSSETPAQLQAKQQAIAKLEAKITAIRQESVALSRRIGLTNPPIARWSFDTDARDQIGTMHGSLRGAAKIANGRLILDGRDAFLETAPLARSLSDRTLEAWVFLDDLDQRGGGIISVERNDGGLFDGIVFGERQPRRWMLGSENYHRTRDLAAPAESSQNERVHVAVSIHAKGQVTFYRNGQRYGESIMLPPENAPPTFAEGVSRVLLGKRHTGGTQAFFRGAIDEARLYAVALSDAEIAKSFQIGTRVIVPVNLSSDDQRISNRLRDDEAKLTAEIAELKKSVNVFAVLSKAPPTTHLLRRGSLDKPGEIVTPMGLTALTYRSPELSPSVPMTDGERRLKFAQWLTDERNPLLWRVMANRLWQWHFGTGIVATPSDFGKMGEAPSHPELLDWLAGELRRSGGQMKPLHRLIVTSATYRQGSIQSPKARDIDADNRLLSRFAPRRIEGEAIRDSVLAISGRLAETGGGPSMQPFTIKEFNALFYTMFERDEPMFNRRSIYRMQVISAREPVLETFDCPEPSVRTPRRVPTTTPIQALELMNGPFLQQQAARLAERLRTEAGTDAAAQVRLGFRLTMSREPTPVEEKAAVTLIQKHGAKAFAWVLFNASEFLMLR